MPPTSNPDLLPQLIGEYRPVDEWQSHINTIFYGLHGRRLRDYYQTFTAADYRLAHALATDYYERVRARDANREASGGPPGGRLKREANPLTPDASPLTILEWGCGNGNLAACFLSHLKAIDKDGLVYPRVHFLLIDKHEEVLDAAKIHPDLASHRERISWLLADATELAGIKDGSVDRILCSELWNDLPTKVMLRRQGEIEEEYLRPNLSEKKHASILDWSAFIRAFDTANVQGLKAFLPFLESIIWEREYRKADWKAASYRKTIASFLKSIDEQVLVPMNVGASRTLTEAKRLLAADAIGFSAFDAGAAEVKLLNDPDKPCYSQVAGQFSFIVNFPLLEAIATHEGLKNVALESQREFIGRMLGVNVITLMDLLATHPSAGRLRTWEQDRLILHTVRGLNDRYRSPYERTIDFPLTPDMPSEEREALQRILMTLRRDGVPDTVAYLTEHEVLGVMNELESLGYERETVEMALNAPSQGVDYYHLSCSR